MLPILRFGVCRSSDLSIHVQEDILPRTNALLQPSLRSHDSPSNDRFSPRARFPLHGKQCFRNTATFGILPASLAISNVTDCRSCDGFLPCPGFYTRFPCSANKHACPIARVAHLPQKPWYVIFINVQSFPANQASQSSLSSGNVA